MSRPDDEIASFYDAHPYPPPVDHLDGEIEPWADGTRRRIEHARLWPTTPFRDDHTILVAGCGTFQAARYGLRYPSARVVGVDVSEASIESTRRLVERHALTNVELHRLPVEEIATLGERFDHVVCTGVVHHLADPATGLRALRDVMTPDGALHLLVYASYGRVGVSMIQEYCRRLDVSPTPDEITDLVATLRELPEGHPISSLLRDAADFRDDGAIADALLNPRDRSYTVPDVLRLLDATGLRFGRWTHQAPYRPECGAITETPHGRRVATLSEPEQFAAMELFRGTMRRHTLIAHRGDSPLPEPPIRWDDDAWGHFVPIRPATAVIVEERLPQGVAAVLINRAHIDRDLVYFADADTRRVFEAIDGSTPAGSISGATAGLLRRLWLHDLVMIDASSATDLALRTG